jgi:hypothetical protein
VVVDDDVEDDEDDVDDDDVIVMIITIVIIIQRPSQIHCARRSPFLLLSCAQRRYCPHDHDQVARCDGVLNDGDVVFTVPAADAVVMMMSIIVTIITIIAIIIIIIIIIIIFIIITTTIITTTIITIIIIMCVSYTIHSISISTGVYLRRSSTLGVRAAKADACG